MKLAYIGNHGPHFSTESTWCRAFERLGHQVLRIPHDLAGQDSEIRPDVYSEIVRYEPDVVFYSRTHNDTALKKFWTNRWRDLEENHGAKTCALHLDLFFGLEAEREAWVTDHDPLFTMGLVCTPDGGHQDEYAAAGVNHRWMLPAIDLECAYLGSADPRFVYDVAFVGSGGYHPAYPERPALIRQLRLTFGDRFLHVGPDGEGGTQRGHDLNPVIASAKVVVGDACFALNPEKNVPYYWSDRVPETLGRGGLLVHPYVEGLVEAHPMVVTPQNGNDIDALVACAREALDWAPRDRGKLRFKGIEEALYMHTYDARAAEVLEWVGEL